MNLESYIRDIPDFPKPGILFKDITPLLGNGPAFKHAIDIFAKRLKDKQVSKVVGVEARGFAFAAPLAYALGCGVTLVRKPGKLPYKTIRKTYALEYGTDTLEAHEDAIEKGERIVLIDDLLATGGTMEASVELIGNLGGEIVEIDFLVELNFLNGRNRLGNNEIFSVIQYSD